MVAGSHEGGQFVLGIGSRRATLGAVRCRGLSDAGQALHGFPASSAANLVDGSGEKRLLLLVRVGRACPQEVHRAALPGGS